MDNLFLVVERAKKEWETAVDAIAEGVVLFDPTTLTIRRANWPLARWLETTPKQMAGGNLYRLLNQGKSDFPPLEAFLRSFSEASIEIQPNGTDQQWVLSVFPIDKTSPLGASSVLVIRDVTQERQLQQSVIESERRAAMIRTVTGLAQQLIPSVGYIQQQLSTIHAHLDELRSALVDYRVALSGRAEAPETLTAPHSVGWEEIEDRHQVETLLTDIDQAVIYSMKDLLHIYKSVDDLGQIDGPDARMKFNDLHQIFENIISYLWPDLRNRISIERRYQKDLPLVRSNQLRLQTALMSLMVVCTQSIHNEGRIRITTSRSEGRARITVEGKGRYSTEGLDAKSTAPESETMLNPKAGLIQRIIDEHEGEIEIVDESLGRLTVVVHLPLEKVPILSE